VVERSVLLHQGCRRATPIVRTCWRLKTKTSFLIAVAENDDKQRPMDKDVLKETFSKAKLAAEIEVYPAAHGWCPPDTKVYNEPAAEKAWARLLALYKTALA
jgi:carboxymethylenebutenolidase